MLDKTAPYDLAIAFRGVPRRLREAEGTSGVQHDAEVDGLVARAAQVMGVAADPTAVADAIHAVPPAEWDQAQLDAIRAIALELGKVMRRIAAINGHPDDD